MAAVLSIVSKYVLMIKIDHKNQQVGVALCIKVFKEELQINGFN